RVARVIKSNSPVFPVGLELLDPTFSDFLARLGEGSQPPAAEEVPEEIEITEDVIPALPTLSDLLEQAAEFGLARADVATASRYHCGVSDLERLTSEQIDTLYERLMARYGASEEVLELELPSGSANGRNGGRKRAS
ncbi:MAG: hypothetical protein ACRDIB_14885, partial [Ardenticatenaceae bacterium]